MISSNDFRNGVSIDLDGDAFIVVDFQHVKPGKGSAFVRTKLKNVRTGGVVERTFAAGEKVPKSANRCNICITMAIMYLWIIRVMSRCL